jgi:hypothetical protein
MLRDLIMVEWGSSGNTVNALETLRIPLYDSTVILRGGGDSYPGSHSRLEKIHSIGTIYVLQDQFVGKTLA